MGSYFTKILFTVVISHCYFLAKAQLWENVATSEVQLGGASLFTHPIDGFSSNPCSIIQDTSTFFSFASIYKPYSIKDLRSSSFGLAYASKSKFGYGIMYSHFQAPMLRQRIISLATSVQLVKALKIGASVSYSSSKYLIEQNILASNFVNTVSAIYKLSKLQVACAYLFNTLDSRNTTSVGLGYATSENFSLFTQVTIRQHHITYHTGVLWKLTQNLNCTYGIKSGLNQSIGLDIRFKGMWVKIALANHSNLGLSPAATLLYEQER